MVQCNLCSGDAEIIYNGPIRNGGVGKYTSQSINMYRCKACGTIWHDPVIEDIGQYYGSKEYRESLDQKIDTEGGDFYRLYDGQILDKLQYTGTGIFRDKTVADIGCAAGAFLDFLKGVAKSIVAVEPAEPFRILLEKKGYFTYAYAEDALQSWRDRVDIVTSFDVIEHVVDPLGFLKNLYNLLGAGGAAIVGTPTDAPVMRSLLGESYEKQVLFSVQHLWIFSAESLRQLAAKAGFSRIEVRHFQRYGIGNTLGWCLNKKPQADVHIPFLDDEVDAVWKSACSTRGMADYIVLYAKK